MKQTTSKHDDPSIQTLKVATCPSLSGSATLTYHIGSKGDAANGPGIYLRLHTSTGNGFFSKEWISMSTIQKTLAKHPAIEPLTSSVLASVFQGKSVNSTGFLLAVLKAEGLITPMKGRRRYFQRADSEDFDAKVQALLTSSESLRAEGQTGKAPKPARKVAQSGKAKTA